MSLKKVYEPYFKVGTSVSAKNISSKKARAELKKHYNSFTCENDMKPMYFLDQEENMRDPKKYNTKPAMHFDVPKAYLDFAKENGIQMRGHVLVWHGQTPFWFFRENYSDDWEAPLADRETMLARMEHYIKEVLHFVQTEYPGVIYAWDVVNEAIEESEEDGYRKSFWYKTIGPDFILHAFRFARKYAAEGVSLFYNDYNTFIPAKREFICNLILKPLLEEGLIDGMGMQSHLILMDSNLWDFEKSLLCYGELGLEVQLTELDIHNTDPSDFGMQQLAAWYSRLFGMLIKAKKEGKANVTNVTIWGMKDDESWLSGFRKAKIYPLLFDAAFQPKESYYAVVKVPGQIEGDMQDRLPEGDRFEFWEKEPVYTQVYHVNNRAANASDENDGSEDRPFATIQAAAKVAVAGTRVWIHAGEYRECVSPVYGGESPEKMVSFEAYGDGEVVIKASEVVTDFYKSEGWNPIDFQSKKKPDENMQIWAVELDPEMFKGYNPFLAVNILHDRLFLEYGKTDMTPYLNRRGMVFCDGIPLKQVALYHQMSLTPGSYWVEANGQTVHFRLPDDGNPADHIIELTCREQCFAPKKPFLSYIKVKGLTCAHAATGAPVPQRGSISCYRGHHWIIEKCKIEWSNGVGIDVGNECWHHTFDAKQTIGHTIIRGCEIKDVGVCGIAGMFAKNLLIEDNLISGTGWQKMELSWEAGAMKVHNTRNSLIRRNIFTKTLRADHLWMDCGNENNRITGNLFLDGIEQREAVFVECTKEGINLIDNNIFWNIEGRFDKAQVPEEIGSKGWYKLEEDHVVNGYAIYGEGTDRLHIVNNLIGKCESAGYFAKPVAFRIDRISRGGTSRDAKIYNNIFYDCKEAAIKLPTKDNKAEGNLYVQMPGGFLRVIYPAPEVCLDLKSWQEFYGFDLEGQEGFFDIQVDTENYTAVFHKKDATQALGFLPLEETSYIQDPSKVAAVMLQDGINTDFYGTVQKHFRVPGPFGTLEEGKVYPIDPRKCL